MNFAKMSGAGNDFVLLDLGARARSKAVLAGLARKVCDRRFGVGADGLLALSRSRGGHRLLYLNADGSEAFCGNGARCAAWWLYSRGKTSGRRAFEFAADGGTVSARIRGRELVAIRMPAPHSPRLGLKLSILGKAYKVHSINTGVPHAVVEVSSLERFPVFSIGRILRRHKSFAPNGANVNFVSFARSGISIRTYERGVEDETLACGTGATAAALVGALLGKTRSPVPVRARGGILRIHFQKQGANLSDVWLEGPARVVFTGDYNS